MRKKLLSILLSLAMVITMMPAMTMTAFADGEHIHGTGDDTITFQAWTDSTKLPASSGNYYLTDDVTLSATWNVPTGDPVNLCLNGHVIKANSTDQNKFSVITINTGATLNLYDCNTMTEHNGYVDANGLWHLGIGEGTARPITGGVITGGSSSVVATAGGVYVTGGSFTMNGGTIAGNVPYARGGGVGVNSNSSFTMNGGTITGNMANNYGGGVCLNQSSSTFVMNGGTITGNTANENGGGVYVDKGSFTMNGGSITGNTAKSYGGGVHASSGSVTVGGTAFIRGNKTTSGNDAIDESNVHLNNSAKNLLKVSSEKPLTAGANIGVTIWAGSGWAPGTEVGSYLGGTMTDSNYKYFVMNNSGSANKGTVYSIVMDTNKSEYVLAASYTVTNYTSTGGSVTAETTNYANTETVTLTVKPNDGYKLKEGSLKATYNGSTELKLSGEGNTYTFTMPANDVTVTAEFEATAPVTHDLTVTNGDSEAREGTEASHEDSDYYWTDNWLHILKDGLTVSGTTYTESIQMADGVNSLTLNGLEIMPTNNLEYGILAYSDLIVTLIGDNQIGNLVAYNGSTTNSDYFVRYGIHSYENDLSFSGNGSLTIYDQGHGIWAANGNINFDSDFSGTLTIEEFGSDKTGTLTAGGNVTINGGTFVLKSYHGDGIRAGDNVAITNAEVTINSGREDLIPGTGIGENGIYSTNGSITISGTADVATGGRDYGIYTGSGNITIGEKYDDNTLVCADGYQGGIRTLSGNIKINAGSITARSHQWGIGTGAFNGTGEGGAVSISGRETKVTAQGGIESGDNPKNGTGIYAHAGDVNVSDGAVVIGSGYEYGLCGNNITVEGNTTSVNAVGGKYKTADGFETNSEAIGISASEKINIKGGTLSAFGAKQAMTQEPDLSSYSDGSDNVAIIVGDDAESTTLGEVSDCDDKKYAEVYSKILKKMLSIDADENVKISGKDVSAGKLAGYGVVYDKENNTLTLDNFQQDMSKNSTPNFNCGIKLCGDTKIVIKGNSSIIAPKSVSADKPSYGVYSEGTLDITGTGKLSVESTEGTQSTIEIASIGTLSVGADNNTATLSNAAANGEGISKSNGAISGNKLTATTSSEPVVISFVPTITVTQKDGAAFPVAGKDSAEYTLYTVSTENFAETPELTLQWKSTSGDAWNGSAPKGVTLGTNGNVETTNQTVAGSYGFRITNSASETITDEDVKSSTYEEQIPNPAFVSSGEITLKIEKYSTYKFEVTAPETLTVNEEYTGANIKLYANEEEDLGYEHALITVEMTAKPANSNPKILATDSQSVEWNIAEVGQWGPSEGFAVSKDYDVSTPLTLKFDKAGTYTAKFTLVDLDNNNAKICESTATVTVSKNPVTINAAADGFTYGDSGKTGYKDVSVTDNLVEVNDLVATYYKETATAGTYDTTGSTDVPKNAGNYKVVLSVPESNDAYSGSKELEFTIQKKAVTVDDISVKDKTYNGKKDDVDIVLTNVSFNGKLENDNLSVSGITGTYENADASDAQTVNLNASSNWTLSGDAVANYMLAGTGQPTSVTGKITKAALKVIAKGKNITYGQEAANDGVEYSRFVNNETASVLGGTLAYSYKTKGESPTDYTTSSPVGTYDIIPSGLTSNNYDISFVKGTLTVGKANQPTVTVNMDDYTYASTPSTPSLSTAVKEDATATYYYSSTNTTTGGTEWNNITGTSLKAGDYYMYAVIAATDNYNAYTTATKKFTVAKATLTVADLSYTAPDNLVYSGTDKSATVEAKSGITGLGTITVSYKKGEDTATERKDVGIYKVFASVEDGDNYAAATDLTNEDWSFEITQKNIAGASVGDFDSLTYTGEAQTPSATVTIDGLTATGTWNSVTNVADTTTFTASGNFTGTIPNQPTGMSKANQTITADATQSFSFDATNSAIVATAPGNLSYAVKSGESVSVNTSSGALTITSTGDTVITITAAETDNYKQATTDVTVSVTAGIGSGSVTLEDWTYGETAKNPVPVSETNGVSNVTYQYKVKAAEDSSYSDDIPTYVGSYTVKATFAATDNYSECTATDDFTIMKAQDNAITNLSIDNWDFGKTANEPSATAKYGEITYTYYTNIECTQGESSTAPSEVGTYYVKASVAETDNYNGATASTKFEIIKATPTVTTAPTTSAITYGQTLADSILTGGAGSVDGTFAWTDNTITPKVSDSETTTYDVTFTPADTANYNNATCNVAVKVNKASLTATAEDKRVTYGDAAPDYTVVYSGWKNGAETPTTAPVLTSTYTSTSNVGTYDIKFLTAPVFENYEVTIVDGKLTVVEKPAPESTPEPDKDTEEYTVPVESEDTVQVEANIENGTAEVKEITKDVLEEIVQPEEGKKTTTDTIVIDLSQAKQEVTGIVLTAKSVENLKEVLASDKNEIKTVVIQMSNATVEIDAKTLEAVSKEADGNEVRLVVDKTEEKQLNTQQKETLENYNVDRTFEAYFESNGKRISSFNGGEVVVGIKFTPGEGKNANHFKIYYIDENGKEQKFATKYENGMLKFSTTHFSDYAIVYDEKVEVLLVEGKASGKNAIKLSWNELDNTTKYVVYGNSCGKTAKKLKTVKNNKFTVKKIAGKKLVAHKAYKFYVVAYDAVGNKTKSKTIHFITANTKGKYANVKSIKAKKTSLQLAVGEFGKVGATYKMYSGKKHLGSGHGKALRYISDNPEVVSVSSNGKLLARQAGTATIYIQDVSGKYCKTTVTVQ